MSRRKLTEFVSPQVPVALTDKEREQKGRELADLCGEIDKARADRWRAALEAAIESEPDAKKRDAAMRACLLLVAVAQERPIREHFAELRAIAEPLVPLLERLCDWLARHHAMRLAMLGAAAAAPSASAMRTIADLGARIDMADASGTARKRIRALEKERRLAAECVRTGTRMEDAQLELGTEPKSKSKKNGTLDA